MTLSARSMMRRRPYIELLNSSTMLCTAKYTKRESKFWLEQSLPLKTLLLSSITELRNSMMRTTRSSKCSPVMLRTFRTAPQVSQASGSAQCSTMAVSLASFRKRIDPSLCTCRILTASFTTPAMVSTLSSLSRRMTTSRTRSLPRVSPWSART